MQIRVVSRLVAASVVAGLGSIIAVANPASANIQVEEATVVPFPTPGNPVAFPAPAPIVPWPVPANTVPWASNVYYVPAGSGYGQESLAKIDAYLADQCRRSQNRQYYCAGKPLNQAQVNWIDRVGGVQLQQTHYRCGTDRWCAD